MDGRSFFGSFLWVMKSEYFIFYTIICFIKCNQTKRRVDFGDLQLVFGKYPLVAFRFWGFCWWSYIYFDCGWLPMLLIANNLKQQNRKPHHMPYGRRIDDDDDDDSLSKSDLAAPTIWCLPALATCDGLPQNALLEIGSSCDNLVLAFRSGNIPCCNRTYWCWMWGRAICICVGLVIRFFLGGWWWYDRVLREDWKIRSGLTFIFLFQYVG